MDSIKKPVLCGFCGKEFDYTVYPMIHIPGDHKLKKKVLNKTLFFPTCPFCKEEIKLKPNCIYRNDSKKEVIIVTDSQDTDFETLLMTGDIAFNDVHSDEDVLAFIGGLYKRRVVRDVDSFREKILLSDNNYDDRIIEPMKLSLSGILEKENCEPVYTQYRDKYQNRLGKPEEDEYITTDQKWAAKSGLLKDEDAGFVIPL